MIPRDHSDMEALTEAHVVCPQASFPDIIFLMVCQMSDCGEVDLCAIGHEEDVVFDKKNVNSQFNILMELDELCGNLDNDLHYPLAIPPCRVTLLLENRVSTNHFGSLYILKCNITNQNTTCTDNCPEIHSGRENHLSEQILCLSSTGNLPLAKKFHVVFDRLDESKLTHFLWKQMCKPHGCILKNKSGRPNC